MSSRLVLAYVAAGLCLCLLDLLWLGVIARSWYRAQFGALLLESPRIGAAAAFYAVYIVGLVLFGVWPALKADSWSQAALWGGLFGFFAYYTYDMTNIATLKGFPAGIAVVDVAWGTVASALSCCCGYAAAARWGAGT
jgi:uncharacterized membrane protein